MKQGICLIAAMVLVSGCAGAQWPVFNRPASTDGASADAGVNGSADTQDQVVAPVPPAARTVEQFDTTTEAQRSAASGGGAGGRDLGVTITSLGAPGEPGFWLKTPLVNAPAKGRVVYPQTGKSAQVDLIPIDGPKTAGSRMSLSAMRLIGAPFTGLPEIRVFLIEG